MKDKNIDESEIMKELKERFGAEPELYQPDEEELRFLEVRDKLEEEMLWSFEKYVEQYELIKAYGLDLKLIKQLEWFIVFYLKNKKEEFLESEFYKEFKDHEVVQRAFSEYERQMELKK